MLVGFLPGDTMPNIRGSIGNRIRHLALELLKEQPEGIRYTDLVDQIAERDKTLHAKGIPGTIWNIDT
jgi:hypothetical protein